MSYSQFLDNPISNTIDAFMTPENLQELLKFLNIGTPESVKKIHETQIDRFNKSVVIKIARDSCWDETDILMNIKQGQPTVDHVFNAVY